MKKVLKLLTVIALVAIIGFSIVACGGDDGGGPDGPDIPGGGGGNNNGDGKTVTFIVLAGYPKKTTYAVGDKLDTSGLVVIAFYSDGTNQEVTGYNTDFDSSTTGKKTITFSYGGKTATSNFTVTVYAKGGSGTFDSIYKFEVWLTAQPETISSSPHTVKLNVSSLEGSSLTPGSIGYIIKANTNKYLTLDLSGSSLANIVAAGFWGCWYLTGVIMPNSVTMIGEMAFQETSLISVTIPNNVTKIGDGAFQGCTSLVSITIPNSVTSIGKYVFNNCNSLTNVILPYGVTSIEDWAFRNCTSLSSVTIPAGITNIKDEAFRNCTSLISVIIPASVSSIGENAFYNCTSLTSVTFQGEISVNGFDWHAFFNSGNLRDKYFDTNGGIGTYVRVTGGSAWAKQ